MRRNDTITDTFSCEPPKKEENNGSEMDLKKNIRARVGRPSPRVGLGAILHPNPLLDGWIPGGRHKARLGKVWGSGGRGPPLRGEGGVLDSSSLSLCSPSENNPGERGGNAPPLQELGHATLAVAMFCDPLSPLRDPGGSGPLPPPLTSCLKRGKSGGGGKKFESLAAFPRHPGCRNGADPQVAGDRGGACGGNPGLVLGQSSRVQARCS